MERLPIPVESPAAATLLGWGLVACFLLTNAKGLPFAHSIRLLPSVFRLLRLRRSSSPKHDAPVIGFGTSSAAHPALFRHHVTSSRTVLFDLDVNMHKSNSTFFADADSNRAELLTKTLSKGLAAAMPLLAAVQCTFKRELRAFQAYQVSSRILAWDERSLFIVTYFLKPGTKLPSEVELAGGPSAVLQDANLRRAVYAVMVTRYVCKSGRQTVAPAVVLEAAGLLVSESCGQSQEKGSANSALLSAEIVEKAVRSGMNYVVQCMA
ncbi:hypothetical protein VTJ04DRAFT_5395 [Mycothermus thermophilus]|uniref:uncharacterized protein n=1 Tax=Humicola insolens TaxID=85995 RepID=UPI0037446A4F